MNNFEPKSIPLYFNGVFYELDSSLSYEKLIFYNINLVVEIYKNNTFIFREHLKPSETIKIPITTIEDFNKVTSILGYGELLKKDSNLHNPRTFTFKDSNFTVTDFGVYVDNEMYFLFNHDKESIDFVTKEKVEISEHEKFLIYTNLQNSLYNFGWFLNTLINNTTDLNLIKLIFKLQNRLDISKKHTNT